MGFDDRLIGVVILIGGGVREGKRGGLGRVVVCVWDMGRGKYEREMKIIKWFKIIISYILKSQQKKAVN